LIREFDCYTLNEQAWYASKVTSLPLARLAEVGQSVDILPGMKA